MALSLKVKSGLQKIWSVVLHKKNPEAVLDHEQIIVMLAKIFKPKVYVELGLYECRLFNKMVPYVSKKLIGVDTSARAGEFMSKNEKTEFHCKTTTELAQELRQRGVVIDMMFIDADHSQKSVLEDFKNYFAMVKEDGIIFLHDAYPKNADYTQSGYCGDGYKTIFELSKQTGEHELVTLPLHPGLAICRKRTKQMRWLEN